MYYTRNSLAAGQTDCTNTVYYLDVTKITDTFDETYVTNSYYDEVAQDQVYAHTIKHTAHTGKKRSKLKLLHALRIHNIKYKRRLVADIPYLPHRVKRQRE